MTRDSVAGNDATALLGGTFDPVHYGHLRAALEVREQLSLRKLLLLPAGTPPHRPAPVASALHRLAMLKLAVEAYSDLVVDDREVKRGGSSFMVDTLGELRAERDTGPVILVIGQDAANALDAWHRWRQLFELAHLVIMRRPHSIDRYSGQLSGEIQRRTIREIARLHRQPAGLVLPLQVTQLAISSTDIRSRFVSGRSPRFLMPDCVIAYIRHHGLYHAVPAAHAE